MEAKRTKHRVSKGKAETITISEASEVSFVFENGHIYAVVSSEGDVTVSYNLTEQPKIE